MRRIQLGIREMDSRDAQQSWVPYHPPRDDCSQGFCSIYCPQWCYIIFPPPPPPETIPSSSTFSPLVIAFIGILASVFLLVIYYTIISKCFSNHHTRDVEEQEEARVVGEEGEEERRNQNLHAQTPRGLDEAVIRSIAKYRYRKLDALVCCTDCSVCLTEFAEGEVVRLLPKCGHAFHVSCIDTWLKSHSNCPLCRNHVVVPLPTPVIVAPAPPSPEEMVVVDVETQERTSAVGEEETEAMPGHAKFTRVADVMEVEDQESDSGVRPGGSGSCSRWRGNGALHCVVMKRSSSSPGRLMQQPQEEVGNINGNIDNDQYRRRHCYRVD